MNLECKMLTLERAFAAIYPHDIVCSTSISVIGDARYEGIIQHIDGTTRKLKSSKWITINGVWRRRVENEPRRTSWLHNFLRGMGSILVLFPPPRRSSLGLPELPKLPEPEWTKTESKP